MIINNYVCHLVKMKCHASYDQTLLITRAWHDSARNITHFCHTLTFIYGRFETVGNVTAHCRHYIIFIHDLIVVKLIWCFRPWLLFWHPIDKKTPSLGWQLTRFYIIIVSLCQLLVSQCVPISYNINPSTVWRLLVNPITITWIQISICNWCG